MHVKHKVVFAIYLSIFLHEKGYHIGSTVYVYMYHACQRVFCILQYELTMRQEGYCKE